MKPVTQISKFALIGLLGLGSAVGVVSCSNPPEGQPQAEEGASISEEPTETAEVPEVITEEPEIVGETIVEVASSNAEFSTFTKAVEAAGLKETLAEGTYTVFAPTDEAFNALPEGTLDELLKPENKDQLVKVLQYHVVPVKVAAAEITPGKVATVEGAEVDLQVDEATQEVKVNEANVVQPDIEASNGIIHAIDQVILPPNS